MRQIRHWTVGEAFRNRFPELTQLIDLDSGQISIDSPYQMATSPQSVLQHSPP